MCKKKAMNVTWCDVTGHGQKNMENKIKQCQNRFSQLQTGFDVKHEAHTLRSKKANRRRPQRKTSLVTINSHIYFSLFKQTPSQPKIRTNLFESITSRFVLFFHIRFFDLLLLYFAFTFFTYSAVGCASPIIVRARAERKNVDWLKSNEWTTECKTNFDEQKRMRWLLQS